MDLTKKEHGKWLLAEFLTIIAALTVFTIFIRPALNDHIHLFHSAPAKIQAKSYTKYHGNVIIHTWKVTDSGAINGIPSESDMNRANHKADEYADSVRNINNYNTHFSTTTNGTNQGTGSGYYTVSVALVKKHTSTATKKYRSGVLTQLKKLHSELSSVDS